MLLRLNSNCPFARGCNRTRTARAYPQCTPRRQMVVHATATVNSNVAVTEPAPFPQTSAEELVQLLKQKANIVVLDVRNPDEVAAGKIAGSVNILAKDIMNADDTSVADAFLAQARASGAQRVVVHCMMCQSRGPKSARALAARMQAKGWVAPAVTFLTNGIGGFMEKFAESERELVVLPESGVWAPPDH